MVTTIPNMVTFKFHCKRERAEKIRENLPDDDVAWGEVILDALEGNEDTTYVSLGEHERAALITSVEIAKRSSDDTLKRKYGYRWDETLLEELSNDN